MNRPNFQVKLKCPGCGAEVPSISFTKRFVFEGGFRHGLSFVWVLECCDAILFDENLIWESEENDGDGEVYSTLLGRNGEVVLSWREGS